MTFFPTNHYPGVYWPGSRQVEAGLPVVAAPPFFDQLTADNIAASGIRETIVLRSEERRQLTFFGLDALETAQWGQYFTERGGRGQQAELLVDRFTGRVFTFQNTAADQNSDQVSAYLVSPSYQYITAVGKFGLVTAASQSTLRFWTNNASVNAANASLSSSQSTIVIVTVCSFTGNDSVQHIFWQLNTSGGGTGSGGFAQMTKTIVNQIEFLFQDKAGATRTITLSGTWNWPSGTIVTIIVGWTAGGSLGLQTQVSGSPIREVTGSLSGSTLDLFTHLLSVGADINGTQGLTNAVLLHFATYKRAYTDPTVLLSHFPLGRNYYSKAELVERTFNPARISPGVDAWQWTWTFRQGF